MARTRGDYPGEQVEHRHVECLSSSRLVQVFDVRCHAERSDRGEEERCAEVQVVVPRRGVFTVHGPRGTVVVNPGTAVVFGRGDVQRVTHPTDGGDECTVLVYADPLVEEALSSVEGCHGVIGSSTQLGAHLLTLGLERCREDDLVGDDAALLLLGALADDLRGRSSTPTDRAHRVRAARVAEAHALLACHPDRRWTLSSIAAEVHWSPYHLARVFRSVTGMTIHDYLLRLRVGLALERLAQGETQFSRLATDLGFSHHSHFSARFRSVTGMTPRAVRRVLTTSELREMRTILTVPRIAFS